MAAKGFTLKGGLTLLGMTCNGLVAVEPEAGHFNVSMQADTPLDLALIKVISIDLQ